jgi:murein DD-endopeptidase MepM/ murein hydrolase activator NlpD
MRRAGSASNFGTAGMTGSVSKPQLHFELRKGATPVDPIPLLAS